MSRYELQLILEDVGLSEKEAAVYLACLEIGTGLASAIAKRAGINRCTTYAILEKLTTKGLIIQFIENENKLYQVEDLLKLSKYVELRKNRLEENIKTIRENLFEFEKIQNREFGRLPKVIVMDSSKMENFREETGENVLTISPSRNLFQKGEEKEKTAFENPENSPEIKIYEDQITMISKGNFAIIIKDKNISDMHRRIFEMAWESLQNKREHRKID